eukprot:COSAG02_NODE_1214_length_13857_cov_17.738334_3_plen_167_part_00
MTEPLTARVHAGDARARAGRRPAAAAAARYRVHVARSNALGRGQKMLSLFVCPFLIPPYEQYVVYSKLFKWQVAAHIKCKIGKGGNALTTHPSGDREAVDSNPVTQYRLGLIYELTLSITENSITLEYAFLLHPRVPWSVERGELDTGRRQARWLELWGAVGCVGH